MDWGCICICFFLFGQFVFVFVFCFFVFGQCIGDVAGRCTGNLRSTCPLVNAKRQEHQIFPNIINSNLLKYCQSFQNITDSLWQYICYTISWCLALPFIYVLLCTIGHLWYFDGLLSGILPEFWQKQVRSNLTGKRFLSILLTQGRK